MNILFISKLFAILHAGPTYSVPAQVQAQAKLDNVFWYNVVKEPITEWKSLPFYHDLSDYPDASLRSLPPPFNAPDIVIVEELYKFGICSITIELMAKKIPYVIVPRSSLTKQAQMRHIWKKKIANILFYRRFAQNAAAIQYLTEQEFMDSGEEWNKKHLIIPNGATIPNNSKDDFGTEGIHCVSIGRIEPYQKGLDLLINACGMIADELKAAKCEISLYGPNREQRTNETKNMVASMQLEDIIHFYGPVFGQEKEDVLLSSDVFIMTSRFEGHPMALIEASAYGLPCLVTTGTNMRSEIESSNAGWTADTSIESIRDAFLAMIHDRKSFHNKGINARKMAKSYDWDTIALLTHKSLSDLKKDH